MAAPTSPGWYPAPDGRGQQWWNGAGWSESRRNADGSTPGLPGYQAAPPAGQLAAPPPVPPVAAQAPPPRASSAVRPSNPSLVGLIVSVIGIVAFAPLGLAGIVLGIMALRKAGPTGPGRGTAWLSIGLGVVSVVIGLVQLVVSIVGFTALDLGL